MSDILHKLLEIMLAETKIGSRFNSKFNLFSIVSFVMISLPVKLREKCRSRIANSYKKFDFITTQKANDNKRSRAKEIGLILYSIFGAQD
ncbi:hypothetical protein BpHYR1_002981 [Brachionus plicatilis]|uniref:Uncharacterized protein n=1 Tax=Brachionus plicatilis TaxID=10195 RepID=A0A3M7RUJ1_BRAPC|nr:hypothetical protein BpHYR1_002981 [Brachionus plicatilis]